MLIWSASGMERIKLIAVAFYIFVSIREGPHKNVG